MFTYFRRSANWIRTGCFIGLAACLGCGTKVPGGPDCDRGRQLLAEGKPADAVAVFDTAHAHNPENALAFFHRAEAKQRLGQMRAAIDDYTKALRLDKEISGMDDVHQSDAVPLGAERVRAYFNRATLLNQVGEARDAVEGFTDALHLDPAYADAYCGRGAAYLASGFPEQAIVDLDAAIRLVPNSCEALCLRARAKLAAGKDRQAIEDARSAIHLDANCGDAFLTLGSALLASSDQEPDVAVKHLREAFRLYKALAPPFSPGLAQAYFDLGINLDKAGQGMEAEKAFDEAKRLDEKYAGLYQEHKTKTAVAVNPYGPSTTTLKLVLDTKLSHAWTLLDEKRFDEAIAEFTAIRRADPKCADAWYGRGSAFLANNDPDCAIPDFDQAIYLAQDFAEAYCLRGQALAKKGRYSQAIADGTAAIGLKPDFALAYFHRATAYWKDNDFEHALADLDKAVTFGAKAPTLNDQRRGGKLLAPQLAKTCREWGSDSIATRRWDMAVTCLEKAASLEGTVGQPDPQLAWAYRERGFEHANRREFTEAIADLNRAVERDKDNAQTCRLCGLVCCKMATDCHEHGRFADEKEQWTLAVWYLKRAIELDPNLASELRNSLADAQRNLDAVSVQASVAPLER